MLFLIGLLEQGMFLFNNRLQIVLFECFSDCLDRYKEGNNIVNLMDSLNYSVQMS